jgi:hypothetical protein
MVGQGVWFVAAAGCRKTAHRTPVPYDNHSCKHRQYSHMAQGCVRTQRSGVRVGCRLNTKALVAIQHRDSFPARNDFPPNLYYPQPSTNATQRPSTRHTADLECFHPKQRESTIQRRPVSPGTAPCYTPLSRTVSLGPLSNPLLRPSVRSLISQQGKFSLSHRMSRSLLEWCCGRLTATFTSLPLFFQGILYRCVGPLTAASRSSDANLIRRGTATTRGNVHYARMCSLRSHQLCPKQ